MISRSMLLIVGGLLVAGGAGAQETERPKREKARGEAHVRMRGHGGAAGAMHLMGMSGHGPAAILHLRGPLELTAEQVQRLEALQAAAHEGHHPHMQAAMKAHEEAAALLDAASPDLAAYEAKLREAADHMVQGHVAMTRSQLEARAVLTPEQREKLEFAHELMKMRGGAMRTRGMRQGEAMRRRGEAAEPGEHGRPRS